jgi:tetratricopeptide (TPR) repeat protein
VGEQNQESTAAISIRTGNSFFNLGQYDDARTCYMAAVTEAAKPATNGHMDYATLGIAMNAVADCFYRQSRFEEARGWFERAAGAKEIVDPPVDHESRGVSLNSAGACLMEMKKYDEALAWFQRALGAKAKGNAHGRVNPESLSNTLHHVGYCHSSMEQYEKAQGYFESAAEQAAKGDLQGRVDHDSVGGSLHQVGFCLSRMNQFEAARGWYERAAAEKEKGDLQGRVDNDSVSMSLNQVGYCLAGLGKSEEAVTWLGRAAATAEKGDVRGNVNYVRVANILRLGAQCLDRLGRAAEAATWEKKAAEAGPKNSTKETAMPRTPDAAFIENCTKLSNAPDSTTEQQIAQLVLDAKRFGEDTAEMAYALGTKGRMALWWQKDLAAGADAIERALALAEKHGLDADIRVRWLRNLSFTRDDLGQAQPAIAAAEKALGLCGGLHHEVIANTTGLVHTMRVAVHSVPTELRELAKIWPSMTQGWRESEIAVLKRFALRRKDLSQEEIGWLKKITAEPKGVEAVLPPPEAKADLAELAKVLAELDSLVGLREVKAEFKRLASVLQVEEMRRAAKLTVVQRANHAVFLGPPGTGKTTVARLLGRLFKALGLLAGGQVIEVDRSGLVAGYIGQTAIKTGEAVDSARDGVLFIDEAYSLFNPSGNDFGHEAVATLLKRMEDDRARLVVVFAGYDEPMMRMLRMNPGLQSRVSTTLHFRTYGANELTTIFKAQAERAGYRASEAAMQRVREICALMKGSEDPATFGNAREVRNMFEDTIARQAARLVAQTTQGTTPTPEALQRLEADDIHWEFLGDESLRDTLDAEALRTVAVHEMGHALVGYHVDGPPPVLVTTIPSSHALGRTFFAESASPVFTRAQLVGRAARALAGRAAEEVVFGVLTSGAAHDLEVAERIAIELLRTGMSEETTHDALEEYAATSDGERGGGGRDTRTRKEVGELLQEAYALAVKLVRAQEAALRLATDRLVERRTLNGVELAGVFGPRLSGRRGS